MIWTAAPKELDGVAREMGSWLGGSPLQCWI